MIQVKLLQTVNAFSLYRVDMPLALKSFRSSSSCPVIWDLYGNTFIPAVKSGLRCRVVWWFQVIATIVVFCLLKCDFFFFSFKVTFTYIVSKRPTNKTEKPTICYRLSGLNPRHHPSQELNDIYLGFYAHKWFNENMIFIMCWPTRFLFWSRSGGWWWARVCVCFSLVHKKQVHFVLAILSIKLL